MQSEGPPPARDRSEADLDDLTNIRFRDTHTVASQAGDSAPTGPYPLCPPDGTANESGRILPLTAAGAKRGKHPMAPAFFFS
jgi:hypothetical protein